MTALKPGPHRGGWGVRSDSPVEPASAAALAADVLPTHLLDGGEIVVFAIKPSLWFIPLVSRWWCVAAALVVAATRLGPLSGMELPLIKLGLALALCRLTWATLQWSGRLYVLTNRRVMLIRGVFNVELFECPLVRIQNTWMTLTLVERLLRLGSIHMSTAAGATAGGVATWRTVARPLELHEKLRTAVERARHRGNHGV